MPSNDGVGQGASGSDASGGTILALVADLMFASRIRGTASALGVAAMTVHNADEILARAHATSPRLILLDLETRGADVIALIRALKSDPKLQRIPVIAFGPHVRSDALARAHEAGADRVLARSAFVRELPTLLRGEQERGGGA